MKFKQLTLIGLPALALGLLIGNLLWNPSMWAFFDPAYWKGLGKVGESMRLIHFRYVDEEEASFENLSETAVSELVNNLDKHSRYMSLDDFKDFDLSSKRQYYGIGVAIYKSDDRIMITRVFPGGGAESAGVRAGDRILAVESTRIVDATSAEVSALIRGAAGTEISLLLEDENNSSREIQVTRGKVQLASVDAVRMIDDIGYLRIDQFIERTGQEFDEAMAYLNRQGMQYLVIDLRGNAGGRLDAAVNVLGHFFNQDEEVVSIAGRSRAGNTYLSSGKGQSAVPMVVLINEGSASSSEIVAGALQVTNKAKLVGESSYGKGSVQTIFSMDDGSGMRLTTARYFLPGKIPIGEDGLVPDLKVVCDQDTWEKLLLQRDQDPFANAELFEKRFGFAPVKDFQLEMALRLLRGEPIDPVEETNLPQEVSPDP